MSLTGSLLGTLISVVTAAAFVAVVVMWPSFSGRRAGHVAARAGLMVGVNLLVLVTAAVQLNDQFLFFADWSDLHGAFGGATTSTTLQRGGTAERAASAHVPGTSVGAATPTSPSLPLPTGTSVGDGALSYTITGPVSGITGTVVVALPADYTSPRTASTRYPVLETFSGYPGSVTQWVKTMTLPTSITQQVTARRLRAALIVSPQTQIPTGVDTECVNGRAGSPQLESWLAQDVPTWVSQHFRVDTDRGSWASIGLSTGGWCAAMVAMLHPAQYSAAIVLGGYFRPEFSPFYEPYPTGSPLAARYDLVALAKRGSPPLALWLETSHADPVSYTSTAALLKAARPPLSVAATVLQNAGHRMSVWQDLLPQALSWLGANVPGFQPRT